MVEIECRPQTLTLFRTYVENISGEQLVRFESWARPTATIVSSGKCMHPVDFGDNSATYWVSVSGSCGSLIRISVERVGRRQNLTSDIDSGKGIFDEYISTFVEGIHRIGYHMHGHRCPLHERKTFEIFSRSILANEDFMELWHASLETTNSMTCSEEMIRVHLGLCHFWRMKYGKISRPSRNGREEIV